MALATIFPSPARATHAAGKSVKMNSLALQVLGKIFGGRFSLGLRSMTRSSPGYPRLGLQPFGWRRSGELRLWRCGSGLGFEGCEYEAQCHSHRDRILWVGISRQRLTVRVQAVLLGAFDGGCRAKSAALTPPTRSPKSRGGRVAPQAASRPVVAVAGSRANRAGTGSRFWRDGRCRVRAWPPPAARSSHPTFA